MSEHQEGREIHINMSSLNGDHIRRWLYDNADEVRAALDRIRPRRSSPIRAALAGRSSGVQESAMEATFKLSAELTIRVSTLEGSLNFEIVEGCWFGEGEDTRKRHGLWFDKATGRAIASAMMGCAASL